MRGALLVATLAGCLGPELPATDYDALPLCARDAGAVDAPVGPIAAIVFVLDYSSSMGAHLPGEATRAVDVVEAALTAALERDPPLDVDVGAVAFGDSLVGEIPLGAAANVVAALGLWDLEPGLTCTADALSAAADVVATSPLPSRHVVLVSDGMPNDCGGTESAQAGAVGLWGDDVTIHTLHLIWSQPIDVADLVAFMQSISGTPGSHADPSYYHAAATSAEVGAQLDAILAVILEGR
jgi:hypothetical protein